MLETIMTFSTPHLDRVIDFPFLKRKDARTYLIMSRHGERALAEVQVNEHFDQLVATYSSEWLLEDYEIIHETLLYLARTLQGEWDDSKSFLGYLPSGEEAYILTHWKDWLAYLNESSLNCAGGDSRC